MKIFGILTILLLAPSLSLACTFPYQGEEYDALINVERKTSSEVKGEIDYILTFPVNVNKNDVSKANIYLYKDEHVKIVQMKSEELEEVTEIDEYINVPFAYEKHGDKFVGSFSVNKFADLNIKVLIEWGSKGCCMCSTYGYKQIKHEPKLETVQNE